jgi:hypothetical protein
MLSLTILYNIMRELPFTLFVVKILRVSLCFWPRFNKIDVERINKIFVSVMKNESFFTYACILYVCILNGFLPYAKDQ